MRNLFKFIKTTIIGGFFVILPLLLLTYLFTWAFNSATDLIRPITGYIIKATQTNQHAAEFIAFGLILASCFLLGLIVRTGIGKWVQHLFEDFIFKRIPGYKMLKDFLDQLQPEKRQSFKQSVLVHLDDGKMKFYGLVTDEYGDGQYSVFIPTSPSPINGFVVQTSKDNLTFLDVTPDQLLKSVVGCGVGAHDIGPAGAFERKPTVLNP